MAQTRKKYDEEFKKNAVMLSYASNKTVLQVAEDLDISDGMLYRWRQKYTPDGDKTRYATMDEELKALKLENAQLKMERDMLKRQAPTLRASTSNLCVHGRTERLPRGGVGEIL